MSLRGSILLAWSTLIPAWMIIYIYYTVWDEITYSIPKLQPLQHWSAGMDK